MVSRKCNAIKGKWCGGVKQMFQVNDPDSDGLHTATVINVETHARGNGLLYRKRKQFKGNLWLNFCPFCGANVEKRTK